MINLVYTNIYNGIDLPRKNIPYVSDDFEWVKKLLTTAPRHFLEEHLNKKRYRGLINMVLGRARKKYRKHGMPVEPLNRLTKQKILDNRELIARMLTDAFYVKGGETFVVHAENPGCMERVQ